MWRGPGRAFRRNLQAPRGLDPVVRCLTFDDLPSNQDGVYDITDFIANHPGGSEKILLAAGKSVDAFW